MASFMMSVIVLCIFIMIAAVYRNRTMMTHKVFAPYGPASQKNWWERPDKELFGYPNYSYWEAFANPKATTKDSSFLLTNAKGSSSVMEYPPDAPGPADLYNDQPYHLLSDMMSPPRTKESISCVNSRSCYATDFDRMVSKTGNFRQMTNNYKRGYPDSCSAPYQELVLNFYKADPMAIPPNNTGGSVSEAMDGL
jgi:hypothetical protein